MSSKSNTIDYRNKFTERLSALMKDSGTTQYALSKYCYVSRQAVSKWVTGLATPDVDNLAKIADYFNVSTDYLAGRNDYKTNDKATKELCATLGLSETSIEVLSKSNNTAIAANVADLFSVVDDDSRREDAINKLMNAITTDIRFIVDKLIEDYISTQHSKESSIIDLLKKFYETMAISETLFHYQGEDGRMINSQMVLYGTLNDDIVPYSVDLKNILSDSIIGEISARLYSIKRNVMKEDKK